MSASSAVIVEGLSYADALAALTDRGRFGIRLGLGRIRAILRELGNPERGIRGALVAGTNGKGSVLALAAAALRSAGYRVGQTPKPHLVSYRERVLVDGRPISPEAFARHVAAILPVADRVGRRLGPPTEFELLTAVVFRHFAEVGIDVALVEVGLGGRLDATHAWDGGVAVVTNVALDHMQYLGTTIPEIAREKAAIIERGDRAVTGASDDALEVIRRRARRVGAPLRVVEPAPIRAVDRDGLVVDLPGLESTRLGLRGRHQAANVAVADALLDELDAAGIAHAGPDARRAGYRDARWPGRLELVTIDGRHGPLDVLLDGAHNPAGAAALAEALDDLRPFLGPDAITLLTATMADKDVEGIVAALSGARSMQHARVVATDMGERSLPADQLAAVWARLGAGAAVAEPDPGAALDRALSIADGPVVVAGSLYLVGFVRGRLVSDADLVDPPIERAETPR